MMRSERMAEAFPELIRAEDSDLWIQKAISDLEKGKERKQEEK